MIQTHDIEYINNILNKMNKLCMQAHEVDIVIYHGKCTDGFTSALCAYDYFKKINSNKKIEYYAASYGNLPPDVTEKNVLICDFSYKYDLMKILLKKSNKLVILDHHKSAEKDLALIDSNNKIFEMDCCGCFLSWLYFNKENFTEKYFYIPPMITYVEDNDIWLKQQPNTKEFTAYIFSLPFEFECYEKLLDSKYIQDVVIPNGSGMVTQNNCYIKESLNHAYINFTSIHNKYYFIVYINSSVLKSEIGNAILSKFQNVNFSAIYSQFEDEYYYSLRSMDDRTDVSLIATKYGGGGHRNASGMSLNYNFIGKKIATSTHSMLLYENLNNIYLDYIYIDDNQYRTVYLNSTISEYHLGKYLLQIRTNISNGSANDQTIQECMSINNNLQNEEIKKDKVHISVIWKYIRKNNRTYFSIQWQDFIPDLKIELAKKYSLYDEYKLVGDVITFSITGNVHKI
jgi:oligoribonuclease NrnB/cAMP/cGMP phosphodiesterase (DHH superfamily)